jgi:molybdate transport system substrate-binding protein
VNRNFKNAITISSGILIVGVCLLALLARGTHAQTTVLRVMISDGMKPVVEELTPQIEQATGSKLAAQFNSSKNLRDKILAGEPFDAAILTVGVLDDLRSKGKIGAACAAISRTGMGVGVRAGAAKPDIATPEALKKTLLAAKSISFNPTGASAVPTYNIFARLGITDAVKPKLVLDAEAGRPQKNVVDGKVELVISLIPEIKFFPGVDLVGQIPDELQSYVDFAGCIAADPLEHDAALKLIDFVSSPAVLPVVRAKGMERSRIVFVSGPQPLVEPAPPVSHP